MMSPIEAPRGCSVNSRKKEGMNRWVNTDSSTEGKVKTQYRRATVHQKEGWVPTPWHWEYGAGLDADSSGRTQQGESASASQSAGGVKCKLRCVERWSDLQCGWPQRQVKDRLTLLGHCGC